jgi:hypothetical protein
LLKSSGAIPVQSLFVSVAVVAGRQKINASNEYM